MLYKNKEAVWNIEKNHKLLSNQFSSYEEAERFVKRTYSVHLSKDEKLVQYLLDSYERTK